jgi:hypothetical protein
MAHGGHRPGAGRKAGVATRKTRQIADEAASEGITPLEVMLYAMKRKWEAGDVDGAAAAAKDAAPYCHPKLSSVDMNATVKRSIHDFTDAELDLIEEAESGQAGEG